MRVLQQKSVSGIKATNMAAQPPFLMLQILFSIMMPERRPFRVAAVCAANISRSKAMEHILRHHLYKRFRRGEVEVFSLGVLKEKMPMDVVQRRLMREALKQRGYDWPGYTSRTGWTPESEERLRNADLILTATEQHRKTVAERIPELQGRVFTLKEFAGSREKDVKDVWDPVAKKVLVEEVPRMFDDIERAVKQTAKRLEKIRRRVTR